MFACEWPVSQTECVPYNFVAVATSGDFRCSFEMQKMMLLTFGHKQPEKFFFVGLKKTAMLQSGKGLLLVIRKKKFQCSSTLVSGCKTVLPKFSS